MRGKKELEGREKIFACFLAKTSLTHIPNTISKFEQSILRFEGVGEINKP